MVSSKCECSRLTTDFTGLASSVDESVEVDSEVVDVFYAPEVWPSSAEAIAGLLAIATPIPNATASPPTLPTKRP
jgi:hypothetical protein